MRESLAHFLFSSFMLTFFSGRCKFLSLLSVDAVMTCKSRSDCVVCGKRWHWREEEGGRERTKERREREKM